MSLLESGVHLEHVGHLRLVSHPSGSGRQAMRALLDSYDIGLDDEALAEAEQQWTLRRSFSAELVKVDGRRLNLRHRLSLLKCLLDVGNAATNFKGGSIAGNIRLLDELFGHLGEQVIRGMPLVEWLEEHLWEDDELLLEYLLQHHKCLFVATNMSARYARDVYRYLGELIGQCRHVKIDVLLKHGVKLPRLASGHLGTEVIPHRFAAMLNIISAFQSIPPLATLTGLGFEFNKTICVLNNVGVPGPPTTLLELTAKDMAELDMKINARLPVDIERMFGWMRVHTPEEGMPTRDEIAKQYLHHDRNASLRYVRLLYSLGVRLENVGLLNELLESHALQTLFVMLFAALRFGHALKLVGFMQFKPSGAPSLFPQLAEVIGDMIVQHNVACEDSFLEQLEHISGCKQKWTRRGMPSLRTLALVKVRACLTRDHPPFTEDNYQLHSLAPFTGEIHVGDGCLDVPPKIRAQINLTDFMHRVRVILKEVGAAEFPEYAVDFVVYAETL